MSQVSSLVAAIQSNLRTAGISYGTASAVHDVYEGFLFSLVVLTAASCGGTIRYSTVRGTSVSELVFRTSPGRLYSTTHDYTHAVLEFGRAPALEVHLGVRVLGSSGVLHECDVLVLESGEAEWSRANRADPRSSKCLLAVECKYYTVPLPLSMARGFVGLRADLSGAKTVFVANAGTASVNRFLNARADGYEFGVLPDTDQSNYFRSIVRNAYKAHTSRHDPGYEI